MIVGQFVALASVLGAAAACASLAFDYTSAPDFESTGSVSFPGANSYPTDIVPSKEGNILVATEASKVAMIDPSLNFMSIISTNGMPQLAAHPDGHVGVATTLGNFYLLETTATTLSFSLTLSSTNTSCTRFLGLIAQATPGGRFFVYCTTDNTHRSFDAAGGDMQTSSGAPTSTAPVMSMSPDNQYYIFAHGASTPTLYKIATDGSFDILDSVDFGAATGGITMSSTIYRLGIRPDHSVVFPARSEGSVLVFDANLDFVESVVLADLGVTCTQPFNLYVQQDGTGDIIVGCHTDGSIVVANDLSCAQDVNSTAGDTQAPITVDRSTGVVGNGYALFMNIVSNPNLDLFGVPTFVGASGDPEIVDLHGHKFFAGKQPHTRFLLYESANGVDRIEMSTSGVKGLRNGYFLESLYIHRKGCGEMELNALAAHDLDAKIPDCMAPMTLRGDEHLLMYSLSSSTLVLVTPHEVHGSSVGFLNMQLANIVPEFSAGCTGMLCDERHADALSFSL